jgi:hypothetical protein
MPVDTSGPAVDNCGMSPSVEQIVEDFRRASEALHRELDGHPEKIRAFLTSLASFESDFKTPPRQPESALPQHK